MEAYEREGRFYDPVLRPERTGGGAVAWGEMVEARMLAEFRSRAVPVQRLCPAIVGLRSEFGRYPLAQARPFLDVEGRELVRIVHEQVGLERQLQELAGFGIDDSHVEACDQHEDAFAGWLCPGRL